MLKVATRHWPLYVALVLLWLGVAALVHASRERNDGHLIYPLDDTYISMALAKNLAEHGIWGVTRHEFASSSSSLIWPLLLAAAFRLFGRNDLAPVAWNLLWATLLLAWCDRRLGARGLGPGRRLAALLAMVIFVPLPVLVTIGLEHTLHALLTLVAAGLAARELSEEPVPAKVFPSWSLLAVVFGLVATRYEGLFLVAIICVLFALSRGWRPAAAVACAAVLPVIVYGVFSMAHGWYFLPNSILLKGSLTHALRPIVQNGPFTAPGLFGIAQLLGYDAYLRFLRAPHVLFLLLLVLLLTVRRTSSVRSSWIPESILSALLCGAVLLHMQFADVGWLFRYEAYLVGLGLFVLAFVSGGAEPQAAGPHIPSGTALAAILAVLSFCALAGRALGAAATVPRAMRNIYEQQYHVGQFVREHYQGSQVTVVDVGAINYLADIRMVDLDGLASREPFDLRVAGALDRHAIASLSRDSRLAILYDRVFVPGGAPEGWLKVGAWTIPDNIICGDATVNFYSPAGEDPRELAARLRQFGPRLPGDIRQVHLLDADGARASDE